MESRRQWWKGLFLLTLTVGVTLVYLAPSSWFETSWLHLPKHPLTTLRESSNGNGSGVDNTMVNTMGLPEILMNRVYSEQDFKNEKGIVPSFWGKQDFNSSLLTWGPCFPPNTKVNWNKALQRNVTDYHPITHQERTPYTDNNDLSDYCRPGFLIIGAGKCGTSSLYHYLTGHERVLPASEKQIHYFRVGYAMSELLPVSNIVLITLIIVLLPVSHEVVSLPLSHFHFICRIGSPHDGRGLTRLYAISRCGGSHGPNDDGS